MLSHDLKDEFPFFLDCKNKLVHTSYMILFFLQRFKIHATAKITDKTHIPYKNKIGVAQISTHTPL